MTDRETAATEIVRRRARIMGAGSEATAWGCLGARNAIRAGESCHRAVEIGVVRVTDVMDSAPAEPTPFGGMDTEEAQSLCERLSLIPGTRAHSMQKTPTGLSGRIVDYGSGRTMDVRLDEVQPTLREVE